MTAKKKTQTHSLTDIDVVDEYLNDVLTHKIPACKEFIKQLKTIKKEFGDGTIEVDKDLYEKYLKIGHLFFDNVFPFQCFAMAMSLCTFYKGTSRARWNKTFCIKGRGNGKDSDIAWYSTCLTSEYHGIKRYDIDIIANNYDQSTRPLEDIMFMVKERGKERKKG